MSLFLVWKRHYTCRIILWIYVVSPFQFKDHKTIIVYNIILLQNSTHPNCLIVIAWFSIEFQMSRFFFKTTIFWFLNFGASITSFWLKRMDINMIFFAQDPLRVEFKLYDEEPKVRVQLRMVGLGWIIVLCALHSFSPGSSS